MFAISAADGLKYYDLVEGKGPVAEKGSTVQVFIFSQLSYNHNISLS